MHTIHTNSRFFSIMALSLLTHSSISFSSAVEKKLYVSMESIVSMCKDLYAQISEDAFKPDLLIGIARGGLIPLGFLAGETNFNNRNTRIVNLQSYTDEGEKVALHLTSAMRAEDFSGLSLLVIDDLTDSGDSLDFVVKRLKELCPKATIKTAVLFYKEHSRVEPDYFVEKTDEWVVFPWEEYRLQR